MMNRKILFLIVIIALLSGCKIKNAESAENVEVEESFILPEGAFPMTYYRNHIYIDGKIDSIDGRLVFDTGADGLYFDSTYYANASFPNFKFINGILPGAGTTRNQSVIVLVDTLAFKFGPNTYQPPYTVVMRLKSILGDIADGIIGHSYFTDNKYLMEINYFRRYLMLHSDTSTINLSNYVRISMEKRKNRFFVPATIHINDTLSIQEIFTLDIGAGDAIMLRTEMAEKYRLSSQISDKVFHYTKYGGVGGYSTSAFFRAKSIEIGTFKVHDVIMDYSEDLSGALANSFYSGGLLGNKLLERFDVVIDFGDSTALYLKPNQNYEKPFEFSKRGFSYSNRKETLNAWIVTGFYKDSPAEKSGLQIDDRIISINGMNICEISYQEEENIWEQLDKIELAVLRNGEEMRFDFELWNFQLNK